MWALPSIYTAVGVFASLYTADRVDAALVVRSIWALPSLYIAVRVDAALFTAVGVHADLIYFS